MPSMISGRFLLFIRGIVLFIHDHNPEACQWGKNSRSDPYDDIRFAGVDTQPLVESFARRERTVK